MIRKMKRGAGAVAVAMALLAMAAASASGAFHSETAHTTWQGAQPEGLNDVITVNAGTVTCSQKTYAGTTSAATGSTLNLAPTFLECTAFGFVNAAYDVNGCEFQYHDTGAMNIACPEGKSMVVTAFNCHVSIPAQSWVPGITYSNQGTGKSRDIRINQSTSGLKYTQASKTFPGCTNGTSTNGKVLAETTLKGLNTAGEQVGVWFTPPSEHEMKTAHEAGTAHVTQTEHEDQEAKEFDTETAHTLLSASQVGEDVHTFEAGTWKCNVKTYTGTGTTTTSTTVSLTPAFSGCTSGTTVDVNGCEYRYHTRKKGSSSQELSIACPEGKSIVITASNCHLTIPAQSGLTGITYTNEGTGKTRDFRVIHSITGLKYSQAPKAFPGCANGSFTNGTYSGSTTIKATNTAGEQVGLSDAGTVKEHQAKTAHEAKTAHDTATAHLLRDFHSEVGHTIWMGTQIAEDVLTFNAGTVKCKEKNYAWTTSAVTNSTLNLAPMFIGCTAFGFANATYDANGCQFQYHDIGTMSIVCPEGKPMVVTGFNCHVSIPAQVGLTGVNYTNEGTGKSSDIRISQSTGGLKYTQESKSPPGCTNGSFTNGKVSAESTIKGADTNEEQVGVWIE